MRGEGYNTRSKRRSDKEVGVAMDNEGGLEPPFFIRNCIRKACTGEVSPSKFLL